MKLLRRLLIRLLILVVVIGLLYLLRVPILRGVGMALVCEDAPREVEAVFVLSGNTYERSLKAAEIYQRGLTPKVVVTGGHIDQDFQILGLTMTDAEVARGHLIQAGVDSAAIVVLPQGTSTYEEAQYILGFAEGQSLTRIMIVSSAFHTRRICRTFKSRFKNTGIQVVVQGAEPLNYQLDRWWESEEGLVFVYTEWVKLAYYAIKY
jgi:uncharacterized SAM-binding protein YcdF (DUF218 family)